jgi:hypothetical protein
MNNANSMRLFSKTPWLRAGYSAGGDSRRFRLFFESWADEIATGPDTSLLSSNLGPLAHPNVITTNVRTCLLSFAFSENAA